MQLGFECKLHFDDKLIFQFFHDISFVHDYPFLLVLNNEFFVDNFHGIELSVLFKSDKVHFGETPDTYAFEDVEALQRNTQLLFCFERPERHFAVVEELHTSILPLIVNVEIQRQVLRVRCPCQCFWTRLLQKLQ